MGIKVSNGPKTGVGFQITIDGMGPNKALVREQHVINTIDDIKIKIAGKKKLTRIDLKQAYNQMVIRPEDRHMTTFATHEGLYRSTRLFTGLSVSAEMIDHELQTLLSEILNANNLSDDVVVTQMKT